MNLIGVAGQARSGKDVTADYLAKQLGWDRTAFAASVKRIFCETFNVSLAELEEWKVRPEPMPGFTKPVRQSLQFIGDGFRTIQPNIWIDIVFRNPDSNIVISDCRYLNELKRVRDEGGSTILLWRPGWENDDPNGSEAQIRPVVDFYASLGKEGRVSSFGLQQADFKVPGTELVDFFIINDGTIDDLYEKLEKAIPNLHV